MRSFAILMMPWIKLESITIKKERERENEAHEYRNEKRSSSNSISIHGDVVFSLPFFFRSIFPGSVFFYSLSLNKMNLLQN